MPFRLLPPPSMSLPMRQLPPIAAFSAQSTPIAAQSTVMALLPLPPLPSMYRVPSMPSPVRGVAMSAQSSVAAAPSFVGRLLPRPVNERGMQLPYGLRYRRVILAVHGGTGGTPQAVIHVYTRTTRPVSTLRVRSQVGRVRPIPRRGRA